MRSFLFSSFGISVPRIFPAYSLRNWELVAVASGAVKCSIDSRVTLLAEKDAILIPPDMVHSWTSDGDTKILRLVFQRSLPRKLFSVMPEYEAVASVYGDNSRALLFDRNTSRSVSRIMGRMEHESDSRRVMSAVVILTLMASAMNPAVAGVSRSRMLEQERTKATLSYVEKNLAGEIRVSDIASQLGMSPAAFCNFFRNAHGQPFIAYVNSRRIDKACDLLLEGKNTAEEIAARCGFSSRQYFQRVFREVTGTPPIKWAELQMNRNAAEPLRKVKKKPL